MSSPEVRKDLLYIDQLGNPLTAASILDSEIEDDIVAITSDDRLVTITNCYRMTVGAAGTGEGSQVSASVVFEVQQPAQAGLYCTIKEGAAFIHEEVARRREAGKAYKQWSQTAKMTLILISESPDDYAEAKEEGIVHYLQTI